MKAVLKHIVAHTYRPLLIKYLSKTRQYSYGDIRLEVPPEVFHPGYFSSTKLLLKCISHLPLKEKKFLEPGAGSGLISIYAAKKGAYSTATDINPFSIQCLKINSDRNFVKMDILYSDLFDSVPQQEFDIIAINPPYYKKHPVTPAEHAWYCGENGEYFEKLFRSLQKYIHTATVIYMVLCDGCDLEMIAATAGKYHFQMNCVLSKNTILEKSFVFKIEAAE